MTIDALQLHQRILSEGYAQKVPDYVKIKELILQNRGALTRIPDVIKRLDDAYARLVRDRDLDGTMNILIMAAGLETQVEHFDFAKDSEGIFLRAYKRVDGEYIMSKGGLGGTIAAASDLETISSLREGIGITVTNREGRFMEGLRKRAGDSILQLELIEAEQKIVGLYAECLLGKSLG